MFSIFAARGSLMSMATSFQSVSPSSNKARVPRILTYNIPNKEDSDKDQYLYDCPTWIDLVADVHDIDRVIVALCISVFLEIK